MVQNDDFSNSIISSSFINWHTTIKKISFPFSFIYSFIHLFGALIVLKCDSPYNGIINFKAIRLRK